MKEMLRHIVVLVGKLPSLLCTLRSVGRRCKFLYLHVTYHFSLINTTLKDPNILRKIKKKKVYIL